MYYVTLICVYVTIVVIENQYCECVSVALFMDLAQQLRPITLAYVACLPVVFYSAFCIYVTKVEKNIEHKMCDFS